MTLLEASRMPGKWHNSVRDAIATMIGRGWSDLQIRLACAPYCKGGTNDPDLDDLINRARAKWNKPDGGIREAPPRSRSCGSRSCRRSNTSRNAKTRPKRLASVRRCSTAWWRPSGRGWASMTTTTACRAAPFRFRSPSRGRSRSTGRRCSTRSRPRSSATSSWTSRRAIRPRYGSSTPICSTLS